MKTIQALLLTFLFAAAVSGCGVKGKPLAPLKKGDTKNESARKQNP